MVLKTYPPSVSWGWVPLENFCISIFIQNRLAFQKCKQGPNRNLQKKKSQMNKRRDPRSVHDWENRVCCSRIVHTCDWRWQTWKLTFNHLQQHSVLEFVSTTLLRTFFTSNSCLVEEWLVFLPHSKRVPGSIPGPCGVCMFLPVSGTNNMHNRWFWPWAWSRSLWLLTAPSKFPEQHLKCRAQLLLYIV